MLKILTVAFAIFITSAAAIFAEEIEIESTNGVILYADHYTAKNDAPLIILHHQAGWSARGEYNEIAQRLTTEGFNVLAVDARGGASRAGDHPNRTLDALNGESLPYCEVLPDVIASLEYAASAYPSNKKILWGSSYSAALVLEVAVSEKNNIQAVLAFSPASGSPMGDCQPNELADKLTVPTMILRPQNEMEIESVSAQFDLFKTEGHTMHVAKNGVHGSSMLVEERTEHSTQAEWSAVLAFIKDAVE
ncbi:MAG: hypothetical protein HOJ34_08990 [Kordiimonadaceae bacterium]|jgi:alpha-beta hydrolase superfamily lysophospholipase|nr:hypothetical protein [Kordiimonadaceae bacterium]MBT6036116.1 hypothetical protein [Kordiimonadaceae bacterium]MBT6329903.1 hypothetical protein [Kordiimonadaceae bacterium]MBT7582093.1 hypothetical protein [Kordiimonadaceae bacterium]